ncbi:expressed hypothetical protein [Trichoplax adhaerens]|uniref:Saposin B-type domain-containing protein n=1 Tax=Trichoplax adhaerens TaxID=10228 RepID=B3RRA1_TRIAD|nr:expressed hypothetical protein [Trichoplax adhaerens]EDV26841.1 expressed hypothetical protein [Trichoplax adhaerens]|eukprot:XP_002110837.1 expressed hypothetical protein [Trichoplax adhaerens]
MATASIYLLFVVYAMLGAGNFHNVAASNVAERNLNLQNTPEPFFCVYVARHLKHLLNYKYTAEYLAENAKYMCQALPTELKSHCDQNIESYALNLIISLQSASSAEDFCYKNTLKNQAQFSSPMRFTNCSICKLYFSIFEKVLNDPSEVEILKNTFITTVCNLLDGKMRAKCIDVANEVLPYILKALASLPPRTLCFIILDTCTGPNSEANAIFLNKVYELIPNKCIFGPVYGCLNYKTMQQCNLNNEIFIAFNNNNKVIVLFQM